ncbi:MAG TPA: serine hydrolase [Stellaceae bacterium]|jgi:CubicO group peptidase (beta-lactamase class C family)|nr:serine hydrolase [Stellaceae bacterium]
MSYVPAADPAAWEENKSPTFDAAARLAAENEIKWSRDLAVEIPRQFEEQPPWNEVLGPVRPRGGPNGLVLRGGQIVAQWGNTRQIDQTFSVAKSYLSILAGLAVDRGLIRDVREPVARTPGVNWGDDSGFEGSHNSKITWHHLLQQTSEWEGTLWDKPDLIDRNRVAGGVGSRGAKKGTHRDLQEPGGFWEYNDVRINRLSLALLRVWRRPLPEVFRELVMDPIGASGDWEWRGYRNSMALVDGREIESVAGGTHWGGGLFIHARDQARVGLLMQRGGVWDGKRILSEEWIRCSRQPCDLFANYGYLWWLNTEQRRYPSASAASYYAMGAGGNLTWVDPDHDLVAVLRWTDPAAADRFMGLVMAAIE